jgi:hypothetical protein
VQIQETGAAVALRAPEPGDLEALRALSNSHVREIGTIGRLAFEELVAMSFRTRLTTTRDAFLIALSDRAPAIAPNYRWFAARFESFVYVDRVLVAEHARKRGTGRLLYEDLIAAAGRAGHTRICCEVNIDPPNPVSDAFHVALGFVEIGRAFLPDRGKTVRYLNLELKAVSGKRALLSP